MGSGLEIRLLLGRLICQALRLEVSEPDLVAILTGVRAPIESLLDLSVSPQIEFRMRQLSEVFDLVVTICGERAPHWLQEPSITLALQSPLDTLVQTPAALAGILGLLQSMTPTENNERNGYETCQRAFKFAN